MNGLEEQFLLDPEIVFLNHGSFGATPRPVFRAYQRWQRELERQPVEFLGRRFAGLLAEARRELAAFLGSGADDLVFTTNVTSALNVVARSLRLGPGDEVLASDHEYGALDRTWRFLAARLGFRYVNQPVPVPFTTREAVLDALWSGVNGRTRVLFVSHITSPTAAIFPVRDLVERAQARGLLTVVDGAHAPGQIPVDLRALGADFYGGNLHKWLCAPKGAGFLHARPEVQGLLEPLIVSWGYQPENPGPSAFIDMHEWTGTRDPAAFLATGEAIRFRERNDWEAVREACHALARRAVDGIAALTGLPPIYPDGPGWFGQMASAVLPEGVDPSSLKAALYDRFRIEVPILQWNGRCLIRVSLQAYNRPADVDRLLEALAQLLPGRPGPVPTPGLTR